MEVRFVLSRTAADRTRLAPAVTGVDGVHGVDVHPSTREVWVRGEDLDIRTVREAIESAGCALDDEYPQGVVGPSQGSGDPTKG